jgi:iron complex outermembrane receptor protein
MERIFHTTTPTNQAIRQMKTKKGRQVARMGLVILSAWMGTASPVLGQAALGEGASGTSSGEVVELEAYTVLGSSITRFEEESGLPVTVLDAENLSIDGYTSPGEIFSDMVFVGSPEFEEASDGPNDARGDVTSINLRGAGPGQTLVLMNGRRLAPHPLNQTVGQAPSVLVNANIIPAGLIDQIEVLRDGASAIYGTDASAGVVNTNLKANFTGQELSARYGSDDYGFDEWQMSYTGGFDFNGGKTNLSLFLSHFERDMIMGSDRDYAIYGDKRPLVAEKWRGDASIINVSSGGVYANLESDLPNSRDALSQDGKRITDSTGRFHINAPGLPGTTATLADGTAIDDGTLPTEERYDYAPFRTLTSEVERQNFFASLNHEFSDTLSLFGDFGWYHSETFQYRAAVVIGTSDALIVPADNYYNPFGPVTFADGRPNPNRLSGITLENGSPLPDAGIDIQLDGWRAEDLGLRTVDVESDSFLWTVGLRGRLLQDWYWESAIRYNLNEATDLSGGRLSKTGLSEALANDTPGALNVFAGPGSNDPANFPDLIIEASRTAETSLLSYDFRANNPELFSLFGNPAGLAIGVEFRSEDYMDDRDPRIDGTIRYDDTYQGESDIIGVSPTSDTKSERSVQGAYAELLLPLIGDANKVPGFHRLEIQLAGRWEDYDDFGEVSKPKAGLVWYLNPDLYLRASYSEGFTAPNLSILTEPIQRFNTGIVDDYRIQWDPNNSDNDGSQQLADRRGGNLGLGPEESETWTAGIVVRVPGFESLTVSLDYYHIKISDQIGTLGTGDIINIDTAILNTLPATASSYSPGQVVTGDPRVERGPISQEMIALATSQGFAPAGPITLVNNPFINQALREISGWDIGFEYRLPKTSWGTFRITGEASYLETYEDTEAPARAPFDLIQDEINPKIRARVALSWRNGPWSSGISTTYLGKTYDNDVVADDGEIWVLDAFVRTNVTVAYRFSDGFLKGSRITLGVRNLFDEDPPLNPDESMGYETSLHSNRKRFTYIDWQYAF